MTIKQHGGIFGRNPTFNDVSVDGIIKVGNENLIETSASVEVTDGNLSIQTTSTTGNSEKNGIIFDGNLAEIIPYRGINYRTGDLIFKTYNGSIVSEAGRFTSAGNLAFPSGQGIDFSATSGTGTSELFDDYEEGTWTPTYATTGTQFDSVTYDTGFTEGTYTKIGNMVNVRMYIRTDALTVGSASGTVKINGLPFTCASDRNAVGCYGGLFAGDNPRVARAVSDSIFLYYRTGGNTADTPLAPADMGTGANNNDVILSLCYQTS